MNRSEIAISLLPSFLTGAKSLGVMSEKDRKAAFEMVAKICYEIADAMIDERDKANKANTNV